MTATIALDAVDLRKDGKGVSRCLENVVPRLIERSGPARGYVALTTSEGAEMISDVSERILVVPAMPGSVWEQFGLPFYSSKAAAALIYAHRECGPRWGLPYVLHVFEDPAVRWPRAPRGYRHRLRRRYESLTIGPSLRRARAVITSTRSTAARLKERLSVDPNKMRTIPLGVDDRFAAGFDLGWDGGDHVFHLGSSDPRDNTELVVRAYARVIERGHQPPRLIIAGDLGELVDQVRSTVAALGLGDRVAFTGRVSDERLIELYARAAVCVLPSSDEGFGFQPLEALAAGSPLVMLDTTALRETIGSAAVFANTPDSDALADALTQVLADRALAEDLRRRGKERASSFDWESSVAAADDALARVVEKL